MNQASDDRNGETVAIALAKSLVVGKKDGLTRSALESGKHRRAYTHIAERSRMNRTSVSLLLSALLLGACTTPPAERAPQTAASDRPNILLIVADDLAYTDIGAFGGEIETPNLDALAAAGVRLAQFYAAPTCSPTRSMLMSGTDSHLAGLGNMSEELRTNQQDHPGYEGHLNTRVAALPELLREAGYHTYMAGKWHLGLEEETSPAARGFERSFALMQGGAGHFDDMPLVGPKRAMYREDGKLVQLPADFYSSRTYSERVIEYVQTRPDDGRPFFRVPGLHRAALAFASASRFDSQVRGSVRRRLRCPTSHAHRPPAGGWFAGRGRSGGAPRS